MVEEVGPETAEAPPEPEGEAVDWPAIRFAHEETDEPVDDISARFGVSKGTIYARAHAEGWVLRRHRRAGTRSALIGRMMRVLDLQLKAMESDMAENGNKEVALLSNMAKTLEKLIELDGAERRETRAGKGAGRDLSALRREVAARIDRLAKK